jgi:hypothetical protein
VPKFPPLEVVGLWQTTLELPRAREKPGGAHEHTAQSRPTGWPIARGFLPGRDLPPTSSTRPPRDGPVARCGLPMRLGNAPPCARTGASVVSAVGPEIGIAIGIAHGPVAHGPVAHGPVAPTGAYNKVPTTRFALRPTTRLGPSL